MPPPMQSSAASHGEAKESVDAPRAPETGSASSRLAPAPKWASARWLAFLGVAMAELCALWVRQSNVLSEDDYRAATALVRKDFRSDDAVVIAPEWADPLLRLQLGDRIGIKLAGRTDLAPFQRLWVLSLRGARASEAPARAPDFHTVTHGISVDRYDFAPSPVVVDLVDALPSASVDVRVGETRVPCTYFERGGGVQRGGLGAGPAAPRQRFVCESGEAGQTSVGVTVIEDLALKPRRCVLTPPRPNEPLSITYKDVHLGSQLVLYGSLYYEDERHQVGVPVTMRVFVNERERAAFVHEDGDGTKRYQLDLRAFPLEPGQGRMPLSGDLRLEISAPDAIRRSFCWAGSVRDAQRREAP
jgi:hypothetical protein